LARSSQRFDDFLRALGVLAGAGGRSACWGLLKC
jgi:hypothetical protein